MNRFTVIRGFSYFLINLIRLLKLTELYQPTYNPNNFFFFRKEFQKRISEDRFIFITENVPLVSIHNYIDIGSQMGYFVFRMSERGIFSHGIEMNLVSFAYSCMLTILSGIKNVSFQLNKITSDNLINLPKYDLISFLNVYHHIIHFQGYTEADLIMQRLQKKCKYFVFETGQFGENDEYWSNDVFFMGSEPEKWLSNYLCSLNFKIIASRSFSNHLNDKSRTMFICRSF